VAAGAGDDHVHAVDRREPAVEVVVADDVERGERLASHGVDIGERVRRGDPSERVRVIDDGRKEIDGLNEGQIIAQDENARIVEGLAPDEQAGIIAPIMLVTLRLAQGFGAGAEISGAGVMLSEYAPVNRRGIIASLVALGTNCGTLLASGIWAILLAVMVESDVIAWGWRIPFIASAAIMVFAVWVRLNLKESPVFEERADVVDGKALSRDEMVDLATQTNDIRTLQALERKPIKATLVSFFLRFGQAGNSGLIQTYLISFITITLAVQKGVGPEIVIVSSLIGFATIPIVGWLGDRFGRRRMYIIMTSLALVLIVPTMLAINTREVAWIFVGYVVIHNVAVLGLASMENISIPEIFGARNRYTLTAIVREIAAIIATGIGPVLAAAWVAATTGSVIPVIVLLALYTVSALVAAIIAPEWSGRDLTDPNPAM
jgi:MHS family metabolite:H+ symporter-like MFS transporter